MALVKASSETIARAGHVLAAGGLVAFPTETVYGLGASVLDGAAVARIYQTKGRPSFNPLIVHVADLAAAERYGVFNELARRLALAFWPGPLTLVVPVRPTCGVSDLVTAGIQTIAIRVPSAPVALALLRAAQVPVAAPSANRSGHVSATMAQHVEDDLGDAVDIILDGGPTAHGLESTIVSVIDGVARLLRPGALAADDIEAVAGRGLVRDAGSVDRPSAPGQLASHYAPRASLRLGANDCRPGEALLAFGPHVPPHEGVCVNLSPSGDLVEAAANLFAVLRELDRSGVETIAVMPIPEVGLGEAINDRLRRAAAPRSA